MPWGGTGLPLPWFITTLVPAELSGVLWEVSGAVSTPREKGQTPLCPGKMGRHLFAQGKRDTGLVLCKQNCSREKPAQATRPLLHPRGQSSPREPRGAWPWPHVSIRSLSMIYCCCEELFVLRGFPAAPAKVSAPFGRGRDGFQRGERGWESKAGKSRAPLEPSSTVGLILSIPAHTRLWGGQIVGTWNHLGWIFKPISFHYSLHEPLPHPPGTPGG